MNEPLTVALLVAGIELLATSLTARHAHAPRAVVETTYWAGSILVIVGMGKALFLDGRR